MSPSWRTRQIAGNCTQGWPQDADELWRRKHGYCGGSTPYEFSLPPGSPKNVSISASLVSRTQTSIKTTAAISWRLQSDRDQSIRPRAGHCLNDPRRFVLSESRPVSFRIEAATSTIEVACHGLPMSPQDFLDSDTLGALWGKDDARASACRRRSQACATARQAGPSRRLSYGSTRRPSLREGSTTGPPTSTLNRV